MEIFIVFLESYCISNFPFVSFHLSFMSSVVLEPFSHFAPNHLDEHLTADSDLESLPSSPPLTTQPSTASTLSPVNSDQSVRSPADYFDDTLLGSTSFNSPTSASPAFSNIAITQSRSSASRSSFSTSVFLNNSARIFIFYFLIFALCSFVFSQLTVNSCSNSTGLSTYLILNGAVCVLSMLYCIQIERIKPRNWSDLALAEPVELIKWIIAIIIKQLLGSFDFIIFCYGNYQLFKDHNYADANSTTVSDPNDPAQYSTRDYCGNTMIAQFSLFSIVVGYLSIILPIVLFIGLSVQYKDYLFGSDQNLLAQQQNANKPATTSAIENCTKVQVFDQEEEQQQQERKDVDGVEVTVETAAGPAATPTGVTTELSVASSLKPRTSCASAGDSSLCAICYCDYECADRLRVLPCNHRFHLLCIDDWFKIRDNCPLCKRKIDEKGDYREKTDWNAVFKQWWSEWRNGSNNSNNTNTASASNRQVFENSEQVQPTNYDTRPASSTDSTHQDSSYVASTVSPALLANGTRSTSNSHTSLRRASEQYEDASTFTINTSAITNSNSDSIDNNLAEPLMSAEYHSSAQLSPLTANITAVSKSTSSITLLSPSGLSHSDSRAAAVRAAVQRAAALKAATAAANNNSAIIVENQV